MKRLACFVGALLIACGAIGGSHYYVVRDLSGGEVYYTTHLEQPDNGPLKLTDAKTHQEVTAPNHTIQEITKDEYNALVYGPGK